MERHAATREDEVGTGAGKIVQIGETEIGIFRLNDGSWRAYRNFCPHAGAPVCQGEVSTGTPQTLRCPWHAWDFDLATGRHVTQSRCELDAYRVEVTAGTVFVWA